LTLEHMSTNNEDRKPLFSLTHKDFIIQTFRAGGKGGGNQNARSTAVRIIHPDSGARGEARDSRHQHENKKAAFERLVASKQFKFWHEMECARIMAIQNSVDAAVDEQMQDKYLKIEEF
jgi:protein subunit release factor A